MTGPAGCNHWIIDGMNVVGARPDGWWRDRAGAVGRLVERLQSHTWPVGTRVTVVFDGRPVDVAPGPVAVRFAPGGRGAADDVIAALAGAESDPERLVVVTSDRGLAARVRDTGAGVRGAGWLLGMLDRDRRGGEP